MFDNLFAQWGTAWTAFTIGGLLVGGSLVLAARLVAEPVMGGNTSRRHVR